MAISISLALIISTFLSFFKMPNGGSINFGLLPLLIFSLRRGVWIGCFSGLLFSFLKILTSLNVPPTFDVFKLFLSIFFDYVLGYSCIGMVALFLKKISKRNIEIIFGNILISSIRFILFFLSGIFVWSSFLPQNISYLKFSFLYNLVFIIPEFFINTIFCIIIKVPTNVKK